jgi:hypothetical protein
VICCSVLPFIPLAVGQIFILAINANIGRFSKLGIYQKHPVSTVSQAHAKRLGVQKQFCLNHGDQMADQIRPKHLHPGEPGRQMAYKEQQLQMMAMRTVES